MTALILKRALGAASVLALLSGCSAFPTSGPNVTSRSARPANPQEVLPHALVDVSPEVARIASASSVTEGSLGSLSSRGGPADIRIGIGDLVGVTIFEASAGGLFIPTEAGSRAGNFVALPDQTVDRRGTISVPYAGLIRAAGRRAPEIQAEIEQKLRSRAIEPQAVVSVRGQTATQVSVVGSVNEPARLPINPAGERILDVIARAGGPKGEGYQSFVTLTRGTQKRTVYFNKLVNEPANNVYVQPGDTVYVYVEDRSYVVVGAAGLNGKFNFESERTTATEAIGKAGGLLDERANPNAVFIYRLESPQICARLGVDTSRWPSGPCPIIYRFDLKAENGFFALRQFMVTDKDVIYVQNAAAVEFVKALNVIRTGVATVNDSNLAQSNIRRLN